VTTVTIFSEPDAPNNTTRVSVRRKDRGDQEYYLQDGAELELHLDDDDTVLVGDRQARVVTARDAD
jgi:hypothetical protein